MGQPLAEDVTGLGELENQQGLLQPILLQRSGQPCGDRGGIASSPTPSAWPAVGALPAPWVNSLLAPTPHILFEVVNLLHRLFRLCLCFFSNSPPSPGTPRATNPPPPACISLPGLHPPAAGALRRCWSRCWRCGSWVGRYCRQLAMLCSFCGVPASWQANWLPPVEECTGD